MVFIPLIFLGRIGVSAFGLNIYGLVLRLDSW